MKVKIYFLATYELYSFKVLISSIYIIFDALDTAIFK